MSELKPHRCPFCACLSSLQCHGSIFEGAPGYRVECDGKCHAMTCYWHTGAEAVAAWNTRSPIPVSEATRNESLQVGDGPPLSEGAEEYVRNAARLCIERMKQCDAAGLGYETMLRGFLARARIDALADLKSEAIAVSEGLPRDGEEVIALVSNEALAALDMPITGRWRGGEWWGGIGGHYFRLDTEGRTVTHWLPLRAALSPNPVSVPGDVRELLGGFASAGSFVECLDVLSSEAAKHGAKTWAEEIERAARIIERLTSIPAPSDETGGELLTGFDKIEVDARKIEEMREPNEGWIADAARNIASWTEQSTGRTNVYVTAKTWLARAILKSIVRARRIPAPAPVGGGAWLEAVTPSAATKAAYIGEFTFPFTAELPPDGEEETINLTVPWTTIKEIMAAIKARALITPDDTGGEDA